jgi:hypothetical protein
VKSRRGQTAFSAPEVQLSSAEAQLLFDDDVKIADAVTRKTTETRTAKSKKVNLSKAGW